MKTKMMIGKYKVFDKLILIEANEAAHREGRNRYIDRSILEKLPLNLMYLVTGSFVHRKGEMRLEVRLSNEDTTTLDLSDLRYDTLPIVRFYDDGSHETEYFKRPYPNVREWKEVVKRLPVRKQSSFRKNVLSAYKNCCALCSIREKSLLRAAHIVDVTIGGNDTINNGILLCVNHEIAFDKGKIKINPDYTVISTSGIGVEVKKIKLPLNKEDYPSSEFLKMKIMIINK